MKTFMKITGIDIVLKTSGRMTDNEPPSRLDEKKQQKLLLHSKGAQHTCVR